MNSFYDAELEAAESAYYKALYDLEDVYESILKDTFRKQQKTVLNVVELDNPIGFYDENSNIIYKELKTLELVGDRVIARSGKYTRNFTDLPIESMKQIIYNIYEMD